MNIEENIQISNLKKHFQDMNMDYIQKIKQKRQKQQQQRILQQKKEVQRRQKLRKKILAQAVRNRQNIDKAKQQQKSAQPLKMSFPKIKKLDETKYLQNEDKKDYRQRYMSFLKHLNQSIKSKKQIQQLQKKKKQQKYTKLKQQLGFNHIQSKLSHLQHKQYQRHSFTRSQSAQKFQAMMQMPKTTKTFNRKNQQYIEKLKKKRQAQQQAVQQQKQRKQKLKDKLKFFVMTTVKKNVIDGVYDDDFQIKQKKKTKKDKDKDKDKKQTNRQPNDQQQQHQDEQQQQSSSQQQTQKRKKMRSFPYITDLQQWKKKNRLQPSDKIYIITGGYGDLKKALKQRGWYHNPDKRSPCFDLKYTLHAKQINFDHLSDFQLVNHFQRVGCLTTKVGLTKSLRNLKFIKDISQDTFYPKCFDLNQQDDYIGFQTHFKICKALSILKIYSNFVHQIKLNRDLCQNNKTLIQDLKLRTEIAIDVCKKNIQDIDDIIDQKKIIKIITDKQWEILAQDQLNQQGLAKKKHEQWLKSIDCKFKSSPTKTKQGKKKKKKKQATQKTQKDQNALKQQQQQQQQNQLAKQVDQLLQQYKTRFPQFYLTGHNNIWILKPAGLSRGRGITCYNNLVEIQDHVKCKQSQWIAQKYIENPLVILKRKFDIRQWVLITDFNPLTIWLFQQCYIRFSAEDYDPKNVHNKYIHLTNNSIGAYHKNFNNSHIKGNMYFQQQFANYLKQKQGYEVFQQKIKPQIKDIVKYSMMCGLQNIQNRKNAHQLFGYDFMVDQNYKVWLIQINSSPSMDYSTHVTTKLVKQCLQDVAKVIVDYATAEKKQRKTIDTGKWKRIYKGIQIPDKPITTGLNLCLQGIPMKKQKRHTTIKLRNFSLQK